jgi:outer membrane protein
MRRRLLFLFLALLVLWAVQAGAQTLTLEQAVTLARDQAPMARIAAQQVIEASARAAQTRAAFLPMLRLSSGYTASDNAVSAFMFALNQGEFQLAGDLNHPDAADNFQVSAQVGINLFNGGRDLANNRAARAAKRGADFGRQATLDEVTLGVTRGYLGVLTAQEFVRASEAAVKAYASAEQVMSSRVNNGTALKTDLLSIQVEKAQAEERLLKSRNALALSKEGLRLAMGLDSLQYTEFQTLDQVSLDTPVDMSPGVRPEVSARASFAEAARNEYRAAWAGYLPSVSAFASADYYKGWEFDGSNDSWTAGVMLNWSIFDGFLTSSTVKEKRARMKAAEEGARLARLQTSVELTSASSSLGEATGRVAVMQRAVELATEGAMLTRERFEQGLVLTSHVIDAENNLVQAEVGLAQAKADKLLVIAALRRALSLPILGEKSR